MLVKTSSHACNDFNNKYVIFDFVSLYKYLTKCIKSYFDQVLVCTLEKWFKLFELSSLAEILIPDQNGIF